VGRCARRCKKSGRIRRPVGTTSVEVPPTGIISTCPPSASGAFELPEIFQSILPENQPGLLDRLVQEKVRLFENNRGFRERSWRLGTVGGHLSDALTYKDIEMKVLALSCILLH